MSTFNEALDALKEDRPAPLCKVGQLGINDELQFAREHGYRYEDLAIAVKVSTGTRIHPTAVSRHLRGVCSCAA